jgi:flagellar biosynthesis/type III secretory pathway M-ring protein FliF/YscJ
MLALVVAFLALGVALWALWFAFAAIITARSAMQSLATILQRAADEEAAKETALRLLDDVMLKRTEEVKTCTAKIQALQQKYETTLKLYQESVAIDGPLGSKRVQ